jgi:medium-chain acyl-[acyl-carrier-protein] hydrolase
LATKRYAFHKANPGAVLRMFCLPYAGGAAAIYRSWQSRLPSFVEVYPIELPGRGVCWNEPPISCLPTLTRSIASAIIDRLSKPFILFGHSMGGLLCYELAQYLRKYYSLEPSYLVVSGCLAPEFVENREKIYRLPDAEFVEKVRELNGTPEEILEDAELMRLLLPHLRADFTLFDTYRYSASPRLACPIAAFGGINDGEISTIDLLAWREYTTKTFSQHMFVGDHFFINTCQEQVLDVVSEILAQVAIGKK